LSPNSESFETAFLAICSAFAASTRWCSADFGGLTEPASSFVSAFPPSFSNLIIIDPGAVVSGLLDGVRCSSASSTVPNISSVDLSCPINASSVCRSFDSFLLVSVWLLIRGLICGTSLRKSSGEAGCCVCEKRLKTCRYEAE